MKKKIDLWLMNNDWYVKHITISEFFSYVIQSPETYGFKFWWGRTWKSYSKNFYFKFDRGGVFGVINLVVIIFSFGMDIKFKTKSIGWNKLGISIFYKSTLYSLQDRVIYKRVLKSPRKDHYAI